MNPKNEHLDPTAVWEALLDAQGGTGDRWPAEQTLELVTPHGDVFIYAAVRRRSIRVTVTRPATDRSATAVREIKIPFTEFENSYDLGSERGAIIAAHEAAAAAVDVADAVSQLLTREKGRPATAA